MVRPRLPHLQLLLFLAFHPPVWGEFLRAFEVKEGVPIGTVIGVIGETKPGLPPPPQPPYLIVPLPGSDPDRDLIINQQTGEIRTKQVLDREITPSYTISAIPINGESVKVLINVEDVNDNTPEFPADEVFIDIPENTPKGTRRKLSLAQDADLGAFATQKYDIVSGNDEGVFLLATDQSRGADQQLELIVNGDLDRERVATYHLIVSAVDGGSPPRTGTLRVNINIQDLNDNPPLFGKQRYFTTISDDLPMGSSILRVEAQDADSGPNAEITYSINRRQSDRDGLFSIDDQSGLITLEGQLDFDRKQVHEIVVVAKDSGEVVQETSAFITVRLAQGLGAEAVDLDAPYQASGSRIRLDYADNLGGVPENLRAGHAVASVHLSDPSLDINVLKLDITQGDDLFRLSKNFSGLFLAPKQDMDVGHRPSVRLTLDVNNPADPRRSFQEILEIPVIDTNDHAPKFAQSEYETSIEESLTPGSSVFQVQALDEDKGENGRVSYSLDYGRDSSSFTNWFAIDSATGVISTQTFLDCESESQPRIVILASDHGNPSLSATTTLSISVNDVNDNQPLFESSFYQASLPEDKRVGECFLKVKASDLDCGYNSEIEYSIKEANVNAFRVDQESGQICLVQQLDHETQEMHGFTVIASDKGGLSTSTMVKVEVIDTNDNIPEFKPSSYLAKIRSRFQPSVGIVTVAAKDTDSGQAGEISYAILDGNDGDQFQIDPKSGLISLTKGLAQNFALTYHLNIRATDGDGQHDVSPAHVEILVDDDDITFDMPQYEFDILEDVSPYSVIGQVSVRSGASSSARFSLLDANVEDYVSIDPTTGTLRSESRLDHESNPVIVVNVQFEDEQTNTRSYCQVVITVLDQNDNAPEFGSVAGMASVPEDFPVGSVIYVSKAVDYDSGSNGEVSYALVQNPEDMFSIEHESGELVLQKPLDYESQAEYVVAIEAEDHGDPKLKSTLKLHIHVHDVNDNRPTFEKSTYDLDLSETHPINTPILTLKAKDLDGGRNGKISYTVSENEYIGVLQHSGVLILKRHLDREVQRSLVIEVTARDHGSAPLEDVAKVRFSVSDRNDNSPQFSKNSYDFRTTENLPAGTFIGQIEALDQDEGNNGIVEYGFKTPVTDFIIDRESGQISSSKSLDREDISNYELTVEALDHGSPRRSSQTLVKVELDDVNDNVPKLVEPSSRTLFVRRGSRAGVVIGRLEAIDLDEPDRHVNYKVLGSSAMIEVNSNSGEVKLARSVPISTPVSQSYYPEISLTDNGRPPTSVIESLTITVVSETDDLQVINQISKTFEVSKEALVGLKIGSLASGPSARGFSFEIVPAQPLVQLPFVVEAPTGSVYVSQSLEVVKVWTFDVLVSSLAGDITPVQVSVSIKVVEEFNHRPIFEQDPTTVAIREDAQIGSKMLSLKDLVGHSEQQRLNFEIIEQSEAESFRLEGGNLVLAQELDYETFNQHLVLVRGFDHDHKYSSDVAILVTVTDVNDNAPMFLSVTKIHIPAESSTNQAIMKVLVVDRDSNENGQVRVMIESGNDDGVFFLEEHGDLKLQRQPQPGAYSLYLKASDLGNPPLSVSHELQVIVDESPDRSARFQQSVYYANVTENQPSGLTVLTVGLNSRGRDLQFLEYNLLKGQESFAIDPSSGTIKTIASLDREAQDIHALIVSVSDQGHTGITDTALVYISVNDLNDNTPKFGPSCRGISIPENSNTSFIHAFVANDADFGANGKISYGLNGDLTDAEGQERFRIERTTGKLFAIPLDREDQAEYTLDVIAVDNGEERRTSKCTVQIRVTDVNDHAPSFTQSIYSASVKEDIQVGTEVLKVVATDLDEGINAEVTYSIENSTESSFGIDETSGAIFTTRSLNREGQSEHRFQILATDGARASIKSSTTQVRIIVTDANDHEPMFVEFPFYVNMSATPITGVPLLRLDAFDPDIGPNGQLTYDIVRPDQRQLFQLSPEEGILTVASPDITWEPGTVEMLEVAVSDAGSPPKSSTGLVEIKIEGGPAIVLQFQEKSYQVSLAENTAVGTDVTQVKVVRSDGRRQQVVYNFLRGNEGRAFEINSNNGLIRVRDSRLIDFEEKPRFNITISSQSLTDETLTAYTTCIIDIEDVNDNVPKFAREVYKVKILESQPRNTPLLAAKAFDSDQGQTEELKYEIIDGNVDGAFLMDAERPGVILTNIVLDREIADHYELTISATDPGSPPLVGLAQVIVEVIDINDNQPHFAPIRPLTVKKDVVPGSVVATIRANDIDIAPPVTYRLQVPNAFFSIDSYTGQLMLMTFPTKLQDQSMTLNLLASDGHFEAETSVEVTFDGTDRKCQPKFGQALYNFYYSINESFPTLIGDVGLDTCSETSEFELARESRILYSVFPNGSISLAKMPYEDINSFIITAIDRKSRKRDSAVVTVAKNDGNVKLVEFANTETETIVIPKTFSQKPLAVIETNQEENQGLFFSLSDNPWLDVDSVSGAIYQKGSRHKSSQNIPNDVVLKVKKLGERQIKQKRIQIQLASIEQIQFSESKKSFKVPEDAPIGHSFPICAIKSRSKFTPFVKIVSGDPESMFNFDERSLQVILSKPLDYETRKEFGLVLRMGSLTSFSLCKIQVQVTDVNDFPPKFLYPKYVAKVAENLPPGARLPPPPVFDLDENDALRYWGGSNLFDVDFFSGEIITKSIFDYESENKFAFKYFVNDTAGHQSECLVEILIDGVDEFAPSFEKDNYFFALPGVANVGDVVGQVRARDRDGGPDGVIAFEFAAPTEYFSIDPVRGVISVSQSLDTGVFHRSNLVRRKRSLRDLELGVRAKSKKPDSLEAVATVVVSVDEALLPMAARDGGGLGAAAQGVIVGVVIVMIILILAVLFICRKRSLEEKRKNSHLAHISGHTNPNMTLEMSTGSSDALSRFPPQYSEIVSDYERAKNKTYTSGGNPRSELSEKSHRSASSGRGSVEDGDDEVDVEIRMINAGSFLAPDSAFAQDEDKMSESSVRNTEEYLARLGIDVRKPPHMPSLASVSGDMVHNFDHTYAGGSSIYNRIPEDALSEKNSVLSAKHSSMIYGSNLRGQPSLTGSLSSIVHSEEELAGSYNWDYLLDWGPQYQSLAHVFKEISKLKDEDPGTNSTASHPNPSGLSVSATGVLSASGSKHMPLGGPGTNFGSGGPDFPFGKNLRTSHLLNRSSRSPISHDMHSHKALSPNFHPALSPLATKSPSISPMSVPVQRSSGALNLKKHM